MECKKKNVSSFVSPLEAGMEAVCFGDTLCIVCFCASSHLGEKEGEKRETWPNTVYTFHALLLCFAEVCKYVVFSLLLSFLECSLRISFICSSRGGRFDPNSCRQLLKERNQINVRNANIFFWLLSSREFVPNGKWFLIYFELLFQSARYVPIPRVIPASRDVALQAELAFFFPRCFWLGHFALSKITHF